MRADISSTFIRESSMDQIYDVLIVGGGPAGIAAAFICQKSGLSYLVIESGKTVFQGIATTYPEGKNVYPSKPKESEEPFLVEELRPPDKPVTVEKYLQYVEHFVQHEKLEVQTDTQFDDIKDFRDHIRIQTSQGPLKARKVILAFGSSIPKELSVYGDAKMVAKTLDDPKKYLGVKTLVIGGGNSAADVISSILKAKRQANDDQPVYWAHIAETFDINKDTAQRLGEEILLGGHVRLLPGAIPRIGEVDEEGSRSTGHPHQRGSANRRDRNLQLHEFSDEKRHRLHRLPGPSAHLRQGRGADHRLRGRGLPRRQGGRSLGPADGGS